MTVESTQQFKVGDIVTFKEDADRHYCHAAGGTGVITDIEDLRAAGVLHFKVNAKNATWWYTADEIELVTVQPEKATVKLDEHTVRTVITTVTKIINMPGSTNGENVAAIVSYLRGLAEGMGIDSSV